MPSKGVQWEVVDVTSFTGFVDGTATNTVMERTRVPGGWIVRITEGLHDRPVSITFVPDPGYKWRLADEPPAEEGG